MAPSIRPYAGDVSSLLDRMRRPVSEILFEGAQGSLLVVDHGPILMSHPPTSSPRRPPRARASDRARSVIAGNRQGLHHTRRRGPFPTELFDEVGETIGQKGREFGVVTGRKRRCGWFDAVLVRHAIRASGIDGIALTKLDVLDGFDEVSSAPAID